MERTKQPTLIRLDPDRLAATCIADEAGNQPFEGKVAVGCVILNRQKAKYQSDGTIEGTVLFPDQFSGFWFDRIDGQYARVCDTSEEAEARAIGLCSEFNPQLFWKDCVRAWTCAQKWADGKSLSFQPGPEFRKLTSRTLLYLNPKIVDQPPDWATTEREVAVIYDHTFFNA